ncbi:GNAT family N-acetyltransferase [Motilibacter aurantiacus]|uniref:GNAT family N-acetyltransferase n=1 Tax=Motilibacter aurantiacus TaxID=2714955 RepID=UPI00140BC09A|nr:GNAT family N-acetyltransferase [Motilibacter aurantiacus]
MSAAAVSVERVTTAEGFEQAFAVRVEVFVDEQQVPIELEGDDRDATSVHFLARRDGEVVGTVRMYEDPPGEAHLGRLAVRASARTGGIGRLLVQAVEDESRSMGLRRVVLSAQLRAMGFYERLGYAAYGPVYDDAGIPHRDMAKELVPGG